MPSQLGTQIYRDWSKGTIHDVQSSKADENSAKLGLNLDSDFELGSMISRLGTTLIGSQLEAGKVILGVHNYRDSIGSNSKLFATVNDASDTNADIYDVIAGTKSLEDDTAGEKTRFITYLNSCLRLNGTDAAKYFDGSSWISARAAACTFSVADPGKVNDVAHGLSNGELIKFSTSGTLPAELAINTGYYIVNKTDDTFEVATTSGGTGLAFTDTGSADTHLWQVWDTFDLSNIPAGSKLSVEFQDRIYVAGRSDFPDQLNVSGIANPVTRTISWTDDFRIVPSEQEVGAGSITALNKVPNYVLSHTKRSFKRFDGVSAHPEDMVNEGAPSQEATIVAKGLCFWVNENGAWVSSGASPKNISNTIVQNIITSCSSTDLANVAAGTDDEHITFSFPEVTIDGETYENVVLKFNIFFQTWDVRQYPTEQRCYTNYVDSTDAVFTIFGDDDGNVQKLDTGFTDNGTPITWALITQDLDYGMRMYVKEIERAGFMTENVSKGEVFWRNTHNKASWKSLVNIKSDFTEKDGARMRGNFINLKMTESVSTGRSKILGIEIPSRSITIYND